jgi:hypothetical protein
MPRFATNVPFLTSTAAASDSAAVTLQSGTLCTAGATMVEPAAGTANGLASAFAGAAVAPASDGTKATALFPVGSLVFAAGRGCLAEQVAVVSVTSAGVVYLMASGRKFREESLSLVPLYPAQHVRRQEVALERAASGYAERLIATPQGGSTVVNLAAIGCLEYRLAAEQPVIPAVCAARVNPYQDPRVRQSKRATNTGHKQP